MTTIVSHNGSGKWYSYANGIFYDGARPEIHTYKRRGVYLSIDNGRALLGNGPVSREIILLGCSNAKWSEVLSHYQLIQSMGPPISHATDVIQAAFWELRP